MRTRPGRALGASPGERAGWPQQPSERSDFYHRVREFPTEVERWRKGLVATIGSQPGRFPGVPPAAGAAEARKLVDEGIERIREIARILAALHGSPDLGNKKDPVDELVYIILARKTREVAYQATYSALKKQFADWDALLRAKRPTVRRLIESGGLGCRKAESLYGALTRLQETFGSCTLTPARRWSDQRLEEFLCSLPEIHRKSAYCIMLYAFGRQVFPVDTHVGRVLSRVSPYRELGLDLVGLDHKQLQSELADLVPPNLRYSLHVNLVAHGREVCTAHNPRCDSCEIRKFCAHHRAIAVEKAESSGRPVVADLFSGAGGLCEGFSRAGFHVRLVLDRDPLAIRTNSLNHPWLAPERTLCADIAEIGVKGLKRALGSPTVDVLIGAPPCQGFSHVGSRSKRSRTGYRVTEDERNYLYEYMVEAAVALRPRLFLMENVPGMSSAKRADLSFLEDAARLLEVRGDFRTQIWRLNASAFGVPQLRTRHFLVASRGRTRLPDPPVEEYQDHQRQGWDLDALPPIGFDEATFDLPPVAASSGEAVARWPRDRVSDPRARRYLSKFGVISSSPILYNHTVRFHNERDLELYGLLRPGEDSVHALERHGRDDLMRYRADVFDDKYARLRGDRPCKTIVAHLAKDGNGYVHPKQVRSISIREAARIQSFPDDFVFCGSPSDQWVQLGNAVPPLMAWAIARTFMKSLEGEGAR